MNAKIRTIGLLLAVVAVLAAIRLSESRGQNFSRNPALGQSVLQSAPPEFAPTLRESVAAPIDGTVRPPRPLGRNMRRPRGRQVPRIQQITQLITGHRRDLSDPNKTDEEKATARQALEALLDEYFDLDVKTRQADITEIEQRVAKLKAQLEKRRAAKSELVQLQMKLFENEAAGLGFFGTSDASRGAARRFPGRRPLFDLQKANVEEQVSDVIEAWKAAWLSSDVEATKKVYAENFVGDFPPDILESEDFAEFVAEADIVTDEATVTIERNTATVAPIYIEADEVGIEIQHTLTKESDGWKITGTKGKEM